MGRVVPGSRHLLAIVGAALVCGARPEAAAGPDAAPDITVELRLSVADGLPPAAEQVMRDEAAAIWRRAGVELRWLPPSAPSAALPVQVVPRDPGRDDHDETWRLAKFLRDGGRPRAAVVSIEACAQALERVERRLSEPARRRDRRLGLVLGRAMAHEIGHYLLQRGAHSRSGLMRASIQAAELAGLSRLGFDLDPDARAWMREHAAAVTEYAAGASATP